MIAGLAARLPIFYGWVLVAVAFVTMALCVNARTSFSLLYPAIIAEFGWDHAVTAGAFSFGFMVSAALGPVFGRLMDRKGPVWVMEMGVVAAAGGLALATLATEPWQVYATLGMLVGAGSVATGYTGQALYLPNWFARRRSLAISLAYSGVGVGAIVLLPLVQMAIGQSGWRSACLGMAVAILVLLAPLNLLLRRTPAELGLAPDGDPAAQAAGRRSLVVVDPAWAAVDWTLARAVRTGRFWWLALGYFTSMFAWYAVQVHQAKYMVSIGFSPATAAWSLGFVSLAGIAGGILLGALADRIGREPVWALGCLGFLATYLLLVALAARPDPLLVGAMVLAQGALGYGVTSVFGPVTAEIFEGRHYGAIFGTQMVAAMAGGAAGPLALGLMFDRTGSDVPGFLLGAAMSVASAAAIWIAAPRKVRRVGR
jgi:MFS family permease